MAILEKIPRSVSVPVITIYAYCRLTLIRFEKVVGLKLVLKCATAVLVAKVLGAGAIVSSWRQITISAPSESLVIVLIATVFLSVATMFGYVLFRFLSVIIAMDAQIAREFALARKPLASMLRFGLNEPVNSGGGFSAPTDDEAASIEEIERLKREHRLSDEEYKSLKKIATGVFV